jgi:hypothetical protein
MGRYDAKLKLVRKKTDIFDEFFAVNITKM